MPGQEQPAARARVAESAMPDGPASARRADAPPAGGTSVPPSRSLASRTNRPAAAALIATLAAVAFTLARWQTWAHGRISRFILVGRHFATMPQLPHGMPVAKTYGYDGQFFYRLAINPLNFGHTAYGITMDRPYRYMRIGYPALTWLLSLGQHFLVPVMLVAVNIAAIGAMGYLGALFAAQGGRHALAGLLIPGYFGLITSLSRDTAEPLAAVCLLAPLLAVSGRNAGAPFIAPLQAFRHNLGHVHLHQFEQYDLWFLELAILVCFSVAALSLKKQTNEPVEAR